MYNDSNLIRLETERDNLVARQRDMQNEIESNRKRLKEEIEKVHKDWGGKIERLEHIAQTEREKIPKVMEQIERRKKELAYDEENRKRAANTNSAPTETKKSNSSWF